MADGKRVGFDPQLGIGQLIKEAQHRWLRPAEICEILKNHMMFPIQSEPPNRPPSGSVFLFDRKVLRYFRKDGHNWRKKKDGKTIKEAHERLKDGSIDVLHCYYAHGEEDESFQRRSYWMLEEDLTHIVFVHYRNVKGSKGSSSRTKEFQPALCAVQADCQVALTSMTIPDQLASMDVESPISVQSSEYEDTETDNYRASPRYNSVVEVSRDVIKPVADTTSVEPYVPVMFQDSSADLQGCAYEFITPEQESFHPDMGQTYNMASPSQISGTSTGLSSLNMFLKHIPVDFQHPSLLPRSIHTIEDNTIDRGPYSGGFSADGLINKHDATERQDGAEWKPVHSGKGFLGQPDADIHTLQSTPILIGKTGEASIGMQKSLDLSKLESDDGLKKFDSFSRWMSRNLAEVDDSCMQSNSGICWDEFENGSLDEGSSLPHQSPIHSYVLSPSLSQDQLFSIMDFSPSWTYACLRTKVLVTGSFLKGKDDIERLQWSCMFGEVEVPAEVLSDGILWCYAPWHIAGRVPFYVTCSNRLACSEVREFEYVTEPSFCMENSESNDKFTSETLLRMRFMKFLSLESTGISDPVPESFGEKAALCNNICSLLGDADNDWLDLKDNCDAFLLQKLLKEKLRLWLLRKVLEDENGVREQDKEGQCIIHLAAALDYVWAIDPIVVAGVNINLRDASGWSALHWAAYYGREKTVIMLISLGAAPGTLTDPTSEFPSGRTPADLASSNGHKGIAGFLAKSSLTYHLSALTLVQADGSKYIDAAADDEGDLKEDSSLKDSLTAVCTATHAFARIHQAFRVQSFHRKKMIEFGDESALSDEHVLSLVSVKANKEGRNADFHAAAIKIQNKFRGWKGRKDFLVIRKHIIKIQAHVRGHRVRKRKQIFWTFGIVQKAMLWKRKGRGLHRLQSEMPLSDPSTSSPSLEDDNVDLLKVGRKQSEVRFEKALTRVKSMVQYPDARDQYRRLLTGVKEFKSKASMDSILSDPPDSVNMDMILEIEEFIGEDAEMPLD